MQQTIQDQYNKEMVKLKQENCVNWLIIENFITCVAWENKVNLVGLDFEILPTSGHAVVGYGYNLNNNHVLFIDPWNGQHATFSIPATVAESKIKSRFGSSGTGYYSNTIYLQ